MASLTGRKAIVNYVGRSWQTIKHWIDTQAFPAIFFCGRWESDTDLIDQWKRAQITKATDRNDDDMQTMRL